MPVTLHSLGRLWQYESTEVRLLPLFQGLLSSRAATMTAILTVLLPIILYQRVTGIV